MSEANQQQPSTPSQENQPVPQQQKPPGNGLAIASMCCGIAGICGFFLGAGAFISVILGIIALVLSSKAKGQGNNTGIRTAGFVTGLISLIGGGIICVACIACAGAIGSAGLTEGLIQSSTM